MLFLRYFSFPSRRQLSARIQHPSTILPSESATPSPRPRNEKYEVASREREREEKLHRPKEGKRSRTRDEIEPKILSIRDVQSRVIVISSSGIFRSPVEEEKDRVVEGKRSGDSTNTTIAGRTVFHGAVSRVHDRIARCPHCGNSSAWSNDVRHARSFPSTPSLPPSPYCSGWKRTVLRVSRKRWQRG